MTRFGFIVMACAVFTMLSLFGCNSEKESEEYKGVGKLMAERNRARYASAERKTSKGGSSRKTDLTPKKRGGASEIIIEENVRIISTASGRTLAKGIVYLDKGGKIMNIKVIKDK